VKRLIAAGFVIAAAFSGCQSRPPEKRVIVLGLDGMDHAVTRELMARGLMPNFSRLGASGGFAPLGTSIPPQSPVAWSSFITGLEPDGHGIFDFVHRDAATLIPYLSTTRTTPPGLLLKFGGYQVPLSEGKVTLLRHGRPFWEILERHGIESTVMRMPANFPPSGSARHELSGMGTPDILGTYGTFSYFTSNPYGLVGKQLTAGIGEEVDVAGGVVHAALTGPDNPLRSAPVKLTAPFSVHLDPSEPFAKILIGGEERLLREGEWTDWIPIDFRILPFQHLRAMTRFYLKQVRPYFELYASPLNIDPAEPALPISTPDSYASELAHATGRFYTQGMPEDTKGLEAGILTRDEFLTQARQAGSENRRQYRDVLSRFERGFLFYYFGNVDQVSHMMWRARDPQHPAYDAALDSQYAHVIDDLYVEMDALVGETLRVLRPQDTLIVMSDHGFTSWRRAVHLNSWLRDNGYITLSRGTSQGEPNLFDNVDWSKTKAYALGLNALYVNLAEREKNGIVTPSERKALVDEIARKLLDTTDPVTGEKVIAKVYPESMRSHAPRHPAIAPDLIIGYSRGFRSSGISAEGGIPSDVFTDNMGEWSGDHCMDPQFVPGILLSNRPLQKPAPTLMHLAEAVLAEFGISDFIQDR
jgi:predicted AlkP superfamily phosphohydrolase/phosphomutase